MERVGRYEIKRELGRGGMATVYLANDPALGRDVAVKVLPRALLGDPDFRRRFEREARAIGSLRHDAIVPVFDFGEEDGQPFLVMDFLAGRSLADRLLDGPLSVADTLAILGPLAAGLDTAHAAGTIHRDIKPANILFDGAGRPHLADFGIAHLSIVSTRLTHGDRIGTPTYMSPEQCDGGTLATAASDIYSL